MSRTVRYLNKNWIAGGTEEFFIEELIDDGVENISLFCENICETKVCNNINCNKENCDIYVSVNNEFYPYKKLPNTP